MKNLIYTVCTVGIFLCSFQLSAQSQSDETETVTKSEVKIGFKAGYSLGKLSNSTSNIYTQDYESTSGMDLGITFEFKVSERLSIQPEINFTSRGGKRTGLQPITSNELSDQLNQFLPFFGLPLVTDENPLYASYESESNLKYLEIPVLAKFGWGDDFRFFTEVGPYVGLLLSAKQETSGTSQFYFDAAGVNPVVVPNSGGQPPLVPLPAQSLDASTDTKDDLKTVNFGAIIGLGISKKVSDKGTFFADARASYSFNTIQINDTFGESRIGGVIFSMGYAHAL